MQTDAPRRRQRSAVLDFGLAKGFSGEQEEMILSDSPTFSISATEKGVILGTAAYMSPEQARRETVDKKADVPKVIKSMLAEKKPCVVDFRVEKKENVWPMVPAGKSIDEMSGLDILESMA